MILEAWENYFKKALYRKKMYGISLRKIFFVNLHDYTLQKTTDEYHPRIKNLWKSLISIWHTFVTMAWLIVIFTIFPHYPANFISSWAHIYIISWIIDYIDKTSQIINVHFFLGSRHLVLLNARAVSETLRKL